MIKQTAAIALTATLASLGMSLPASAQDINETPTVIDQDEPLNDDVGLPEGTDTGEDTGLPDGGEVLTDDVIILEGDDSGVLTEDDEIIEGDDESLNIDDSSPVPARDIFRLEDPAIEYEIELDNDDNINVPEVDDPGAINVPEVDEPGSTDDEDGTVIYPPADSVNDLEPEDIVR